MNYTSKKGIKRAERLIRKYNKKTAGNVVDILTDFRHYCDAHRVNFYAALDESYEFYLTEKQP